MSSQQFLFFVSRTELLKAKGQLYVEEVPESRERKHSFENGQKHEKQRGSSLEIPHEEEFENMSDVTEEEAEGQQHNLGVTRNRRRRRSYSIKGDTGDVTDGRIVV